MHPMTTYPKTYTFHRHALGKDQDVLGPFLFVPEQWKNTIFDRTVEQAIELAEQKVRALVGHFEKGFLKGPYWIYNQTTWYEFQY